MRYTFSKEMKTNTIQLIAIVFVIFLGVATGHQDTKLEYKEGNILGLPAQYSPASFDTKDLELTIAGKRFILPEEIRRVLLEDISVDPFDSGPRTFKTVPCTFSFTASWYHSKLNGDLPPYIVVTVSPKNAECSFEVLVDMDALRAIQADVSIKGLGTVPILLKDSNATKPQKEGEQAAPCNP